MVRRARARTSFALLLACTVTAASCAGGEPPQASARSTAVTGAGAAGATVPVVSAPDVAPQEDTTPSGPAVTVDAPPPSTTEADSDSTADEPDDPTTPVTSTYPECHETQGRLQHFTFNSQVMRIVHPVEGYYVYTPPCYDRDSSRRYPSIWLLHGAQRDERQWVDLGLIDTANAMIASGEIPPVIIVLGDGIYAQGEYTAPAGQIPPFDYYLLHELKPRVQKAFRTLNHRSYRAIGGISRGGEWALLVAGRHADVFGTVGGHSPAVGSPTNPGPVLAPQLAGRGLRIWLDVGTSDSLYGNVASLDASLNGLNTAHVFRPAPGGHEESYWAAHAADYLRWYTEEWKASSR